MVTLSGMSVLKFCRSLILSIVLFPAVSAYGWVALGHRLVAQIAMDNLTEHACSTFSQLNSSLNDGIFAQSVVNASTWLDRVRSYEGIYFPPMHYIDMAFSLDGTALQKINRVNAVSAIQNAIKVLEDPRSSSRDKAINLRILVHVVADIHQPMHAVNQFSKKMPRGDLGGNWYKLNSGPEQTNLHAYWDKGGGLLKKRNIYSKSLTRNRASNLEKTYPCKVDEMMLNPRVWAMESHLLARQRAYTIAFGAKPDYAYQKMVREISAQRITLAGCRLAALLNTIDKTGI